MDALEELSACGATCPFEGTETMRGGSGDAARASADADADLGDGPAAAAAVRHAPCGQCRSCFIYESDMDRADATAKQPMANAPAKGLCVDCYTFNKMDPEACVYTPVKFAKVINNPANENLRVRRDYYLPKIAIRRLESARNFITKKEFSGLLEPPQSLFKKETAKQVFETEEDVCNYDQWCRENPGKDPAKEPDLYIEESVDKMGRKHRVVVTPCKGHAKRKRVRESGVESSTKLADSNGQLDDDGVDQLFFAHAEDLLNGGDSSMVVTGMPSSSSCISGGGGSHMSILGSQPAPPPARPSLTGGPSSSPVAGAVAVALSVSSNEEGGSGSLTTPKKKSRVALNLETKQILEMVESAEAANEDVLKAHGVKDLLKKLMNCKTIYKKMEAKNTKLLSEAAASGSAEQDADYIDAQHKMSILIDAMANFAAVGNLIAKNASMTLTIDGAKDFDDAMGVFKRTAGIENDDMPFALLMAHRLSSAGALMLQDEYSQAYSAVVGAARTHPHFDADIYGETLEKLFVRHLTKTLTVQGKEEKAPAYQTFFDTTVAMNLDSCPALQEALFDVAALMKPKNHSALKVKLAVDRVLAEQSQGLHKIMKGVVGKASLRDAQAEIASSAKDTAARAELVKVKEDVEKFRDLKASTAFLFEVAQNFNNILGQGSLIMLCECAAELEQLAEKTSAIMNDISVVYRDNVGNYLADHLGLSKRKGTTLESRLSSISQASVGAEAKVIESRQALDDIRSAGTSLVTVYKSTEAGGDVDLSSAANAILEVLTQTGAVAETMVGWCPAAGGGVGGGGVGGG